MVIKWLKNRNVFKWHITKRQQLARAVMNHVQLTTEPSSAVYHCISLKICDHQRHILMALIIWAVFQRHTTNQNSAATDFQKSATKCVKLFSNRGIEDKVNISVDKLLPTTQTHNVINNFELLNLISWNQHPSKTRQSPNIKASRSRLPRKNVKSQCMFPITTWQCPVDHICRWPLPHCATLQQNIPSNKVLYCVTFP